MPDDYRDALLGPPRPAPDLDAIRARRAAISGAPYPWMRQGVRNDYGDNVFVWAVEGGSDYYPVEDQLAEGYGRAQICLMTGGSDADWEFIAAAPGDIDALLARVAALEAALRETIPLLVYAQDLADEAAKQALGTKYYHLRQQLKVLLKEQP